VTDADVVVVGGGVVGMTAALLLASEGRSVEIVDDGRHSGTTANAGSLHVQMQSRFIRLNPDQAPGVEASLPLYVAGAARWRALEAELGADFGMKETGGLMVAEDDAQITFLAAKCARERALGLDCEMLTRADVERLAPYLGEAVRGAELCRQEGKLDPLLANTAIAAHARALGVRRRDRARVSAITRRNRGLDVAVDGEHGPTVIATGRVLLAAGAGTGLLAAMLGAVVPTLAEPLHMNVTEATAPLIGHLVQHADRMITLKQLAQGQVVIGGGWPARLDGPQAFPTVDPASMIGNLALAQHIVPRLGALRLIRTWAGINTTTDGQCVLGALPDLPEVMVAVPGDAGYTLGPLVGQAAAALMLGRDPGFAVDRFHPGRFSRGSGG
jgi:glycine/D-amino acid oxidase-like deaminating enzyme